MLALQLGVGMQQQQNPEVTRHLTEFLSHDSDNRLSAMESQGERNHQFRMRILYIGTALVVLMLVVPMLAELYQGNMAFVQKLLSKYVPVLGAVLLALLAGPKVTEFFKA